MGRVWERSESAAVWESLAVAVSVRRLWAPSQRGYEKVHMLVAGHFRAFVLPSSQETLGVWVTYVEGTRCVLKCRRRH